MHDIVKSMQIPGLNLKPPITGAIRLSDDMQQTLSLLTAYSDNKRVVLRASESGVLNSTSPRIKEVVHFIGVGANDTQTGFDMKCTECLVMGHPDNTGKIWIRPYKGATVNNAWPLDASDTVNLSIDNLRQLNMLFVVAGEKAIVAYTV